MSYNPGSESQPIPVPGAQPYYGAGANYGPPPSGFAPAPTYVIPQGVDAVIYPGQPAPGIPAPVPAPAAHDFGKPSPAPAPAPAYPAKPAPAPTPGPAAAHGGYSLPPPPSELNLPKYGDTSKPAEPVKPAPAPASLKKDDSDDSDDDEDLMSRLKNLQK